MTEPNLNGRYRIIIAVLAAVSFIAIAVASGALYARFTESNAYRTADQRIWHAVICQIEHNFAAHNRNLPVARVRTILRFYDQLLTVDVMTDGCDLIPPKGTP